MALSWLKRGLKVRRACWALDRFLELEQGSTHVTIVNATTGARRKFEWSIEQLEATDWEQSHVDTAGCKYVCADCGGTAFKIELYSTPLKGRYEEKICTECGSKMGKLVPIYKTFPF